MLALGKFAANFAALEMLLQQLFVGFIGDDAKAGWRVVAGQPVGWVITKLRLLVAIQVTHKPDRRVVDEWLTEVDRLRTERNLVIHNAPGVQSEDEMRMVRHTRRGFVPVEADEMRKLVDRSAAAIDGLAGVLDVLGHETTRYYGERPELIRE